jgi:uncharacterized membrane protein YbhN (UPF0104 family)
MAATQRSAGPPDRLPGVAEARAYPPASVQIADTRPAGPGEGPPSSMPAALTAAKRWTRRFRLPLTRGWAWALAGAAAVAAALRAPVVSADVRTMIGHGLHFAWLGAAAAAVILSLAGLMMAQRQLLSAAGVRMPGRSVAVVVAVSTGLARLLPAGPATAAAWQAGQYHRRGAGTSAGVWAVLAGGLASLFAILAALVTGAAIAGTAGPWVLAGAGMALAAGGAAVLAAAHRAGPMARWLARRARQARWQRRLAAGLDGLARQRLGLGRGTAVLAASGLSVLAEAGLLAAAFEVTGAAVPWRGLLLACAAGQLGGRLVPLPGGLGGMEGGVLGALALAGSHPAAAAVAAVVVYRVAGYWAPGGAGTIVAAVLARRHPAPAATGGKDGDAHARARQ